MDYISKINIAKPTNDKYKRTLCSNYIKYILKRG